jgi:hypothetical protein
VTPRAMKNYALALGWNLIGNVNGTIAVFRDPRSDAHQLIIPLEPSYDDYGETVEKAVLKLAEFEGRPADEVLNHLLLPPADILRFSEQGPEAETGTLPLGQAVHMLEGARRALLATAHSVMHPSAYHPRLSRGDAERFVKDCRFGQTERGSFTITIACPLDILLGAPGPAKSFGREVTSGLTTTVRAIAEAADTGQIDELTDIVRHRYVSANLLEALLHLKPTGERSILSVGVDWSKAVSPPFSSPRRQSLKLDRTCFEVMEYVAPKLRTLPKPKLETFVGFVEELRGEPAADGRMSGEVVFSVTLDTGEHIKPRADLSADDYRTAGDAHLTHEPTYVRGYLKRLPRSYRIEEIVEIRNLGLKPASEGGSESASTS